MPNTATAQRISAAKGKSDPADTSADQERAKSHLIHVCRVAKTEYLRLGKKQAPIVEAVLACLAVGVSRLEIGQIIGSEFLGIEEGSRDLGARYIDMARWHKAEFREKTEIEAIPEGGVKVGDDYFDSPIDALKSGKYTFRSVYLAWRDAVRPEAAGARAAEQEPPKSVEEGAIATLTRAQVRYETVPDEAGKTKEVRMRVVDNPRNPEEQATPVAWASTMLALLEGAKVAREVLGAKLYDALLTKLSEVVKGKAAKAA